MSETSEAEAMIFSLRQKSGMYLQASDIETFNRIESAIATLEYVYGVVKGVKRGENERTS